jgi:hypothetical protein
MVFCAKRNNAYSVQLRPLLRDTPCRTCLPCLLACPTTPARRTESKFDRQCNCDCPGEKCLRCQRDTATVLRDGRLDRRRGHVGGADLIRCTAPGTTSAADRTPDVISRRISIMRLVTPRASAASQCAGSGVARLRDHRQANAVLGLGACCR